jgi:hypothetical protein
VKPRDRRAIDIQHPLEAIVTFGWIVVDVLAVLHGQGDAHGRLAHPTLAVRDPGRL